MKKPLAPPSWHGQLTTVGVTGTNGKTTTTRFVAAALGSLGRPVLRLTTVGNFLDEERLEVAAGYPGFLDTMRRGLDAGASHAAAEYTSEALAVGFVQAWPAAIAVFTNLTRDHLDAHGSAEHYLASKAQLFAHLPPEGAAVLNAHDAAGELLREVLPAGARTLTYGVASRGEAWTESTVTAREVRLDVHGTSAELAWRDRAPPGAPSRMRLRAVGEVYVENALAALLAAHAAGAELGGALERIEAASPPPGRFEIVATEPCVVVDYAHTPDALARAVAAARSLTAEGGRVAVVFGAGGDRDKGKRPQMGAAASAADRVVLTTDNPRTEDPKEIARAIRAGLSAGPDVIVELDREQAIRGAIGWAKAADVVVVAGKGHERGQIVGGVTRPFSDVETVRAALRLR